MPAGQVESMEMEAGKGKGFGPNLPSVPKVKQEYITVPHRIITPFHPVMTGCAGAGN
jgi:hypothetical protein